jgi:hypothetical protein
MDAKRYVALKAKPGALQLSRLGPHAYQLVTKQFDGSTGKELKPEVIPLELKGIRKSREEIVAERDRLDRDIAGFDALIDDIVALAVAAGDDPDADPDEDRA